MSTAYPDVISDFEYARPEGQVNREAIRYLYFAGDVIIPERKRQMPQRYPVGGDDLDTRCLVKTNGFLPKAHIMPLERGYRWEPPDFLPPGTKWSAQSGPNPDATKVGFSRWSEGLVGLDCFPGDEIAGIISGAMNDSGGPKGIVELPELTGEPFSKEIRALTKLFMPDGFPKTLREVREGIKKGMASTNDVTARGIAEKMLQSCDMFQYWGESKLDIENELVKQGTVKGEGGSWTYTYSPVGLLLIDQLEAQRRDHALKDLAGFNENLTKAVMANLQKDDRPAFDMEALGAILQANQAGIATAVALALAPILEKMTDSKPNGNPNQQNRK